MTYSFAVSIQNKYSIILSANYNLASRCYKTRWNFIVFQKLWIFSLIWLVWIVFDVQGVALMTVALFSDSASLVQILKNLYTRLLSLRKVLASIIELL